MRLNVATLGLVAFATSCGSPEKPPSASVLDLRFSPTALDSDEEAYQCFGFDAKPLRGALVRRIEWSPPAGGVSLHHAKLSVTSERLPTETTPFPCDPMPSDLVGLDLWVPGGSGLNLPDDVALEVPEDARTLVVEAHVVREDTDRRASGGARFVLAVATPSHIARWVRSEAPVPAIRPHMTETSAATCRFSEDFHVFSALPHMHRVGSEFHGTRIRGGAREPFLDVVPWNFDEQRSYPLELDVNAGDRIETKCIWQNPTDAYVLPGAYTKDEMCTLGLLGFPSAAAVCTED